MSLVEDIKIYSPNDIINIKSNNLHLCKINGIERLDLKNGMPSLKIDELDVPDDVGYEISKLFIEESEIDKFSEKCKFTLEKCKLENLNVLLKICSKPFYSLENITIPSEKLEISMPEMDKEKKLCINCTKRTEITQEFIDKLALLDSKGKDVLLRFNAQQLKEIKEKNIKLPEGLGTIAVIENASELSAKETQELIESHNLKYVKILPKENENHYSHKIYKANEYQKSVEVLEKILEGIDKENTDKAEVLAEIYKRLAFHMKYDHEAVNDSKIKEQRKYSSRTLVGGLLEGKCVCAGYAEILRNACAMMGIEARWVCSKEDLTINEQGEYDQDTHAFCQVKIDDKWYNVDLTWDRDRIVSGKMPEYFLKRDTDFVKLGKPNKNGKYNTIRTHVPSDGQKAEKCLESYSEEKIKEYFSKKDKEKDIVYLVAKEDAFQSPGLRLKQEVEKGNIEIPNPGNGFKITLSNEKKKEEKKERNETKTETESKTEILLHKSYRIDLVDDQAVLYPDGKNGEGVCFQSLNQKHLSETELVTREILSERAKSNLPKSLKDSKMVEEIRKIGDGSLSKGLAIVGIGLSGNIAGALKMGPTIISELSVVPENILLTVGGIYGGIYGGAVLEKAIKDLDIKIYNSPEARKLRSKLGIEPNPRKLRRNPSKLKDRIIKTFSTKKTNPRTAIRKIDEKNDQLLYNFLLEHIPYDPEMDAKIEQEMIDTELQLRSVELCDGLTHKNGVYEDQITSGDVYVVKYWRTRNHVNPKNQYEVEDYETHKGKRENINPQDEFDREVTAYYKKDARGKLYMIGLGDKDVTVFYDMERVEAHETKMVKKGPQKEITKAEEVMGFEIEKQANSLFLSGKRKIYVDRPRSAVPVYSETMKKYVEEEEIHSVVKDVVKVDNEFLGYDESNNKKSADGVIRNGDTAFFLVSTSDSKGNESYYFLDSNYTYSKVKVGYNSRFGASVPIEETRGTDIKVNVSSDPKKAYF